MRVNEIRAKGSVSFFDTGAYNNGNNLVDKAGFLKTSLVVDRLGFDHQYVRA
ncbi:MAG: hypothetical protein ACW99U_06550 [Candidatus Thorarchaeota archaeon]|jgi:hypothetical protein